MVDSFLNLSSTSHTIQRIERVANRMRAPRQLGRQLGFAWYAIFANDVPNSAAVGAFALLGVIETQARGSVHQHFLLDDGTVVTTTQDDDGGIECTDK